MKLTEILTADRVVNGKTVSSKKKALEELSALLGSGEADIAEAGIFSSLTSRERLGSTGLGHGVAIPHGRLPGIEGSIGAFMRLKQSVEYDAHDGCRVDLIFGLLVPENASDVHLKHLAAIAEMFSDESFCRSLRESPDSAALYQCLAAFESAH